MVQGSRCKEHAVHAGKARKARAEESLLLRGVDGRYPVPVVQCVTSMLGPLA